MTADVLIVGAGIIGAACAAEFARRGLQVEVIDQNGLGSGTTAAGMGHVVVMNDSPAECALSASSRALWLALAPALRDRDAFVRCGTLWAAADEDDMRAAATMRDGLQAHGVRASMLDRHALRKAEPELAHSLAGGMLVEDDGIVYAPSVCDFLLNHSPDAARIKITTGVKVVDIKPGVATLANGERRSAANIVIANGLAARELVGAPLVAKKGHLIITDRYPGFLSHQVLELGYIKSAHHAEGSSVAFNVQARPTGQLLIGSSRQFDSEDPAVDMAVLGRMVRRATRYLPRLATLDVIRAWTGFRAATPDGLPLIGALGDRSDRVWIAAGHEGLGVTTSLATARLLAQQLLDEPALHDIPAAPFSPDRFAASAR